MPKEHLLRIAILDDYQNVALEVADWTPLHGRADITVFNDHVAGSREVIERLRPFDIVVVMRERTPLTREVLCELPALKLIASTGVSNASIDEQAAMEQGITVMHTGYASAATIEFTWSLLLAMARNIPAEVDSMKAGGWQTSLGTELSGKTLGLLGLGKIGSAVGVIGRAFRMNVIAWSQNLTPERAESKGVTLVDKDTLFASSDFLSIHLRFSERTRGLVGEAEIARMKASSYLVNTSRAEIVDTSALISALDRGALAGAAVDVFETEPLGPDSQMRAHPRLLATPHIGFVTREMYRTFYQDSVGNIVEWMARTEHAS